MISERIQFFNCWNKNRFALINISWHEVVHKITKEKKTAVQIILLGFGVGIII